MNNLIKQFDNVLDDRSCDIISNYILEHKKNNTVKFGPYIRPWHDNDTIPRDKILDVNIKNIIDDFRKQITVLVSNSYSERLYPVFTDLVLWRAGREMSWHKDDGYGNDGLHIRHYSLVTYLNDEFIGGETVILIDNKEIVFKPKKGSAVVFTSDDRCLHKVNRIQSGVRITLPIWFTRQIEYQEI